MNLENMIKEISNLTYKLSKIDDDDKEKYIIIKQIKSLQKNIKQLDNNNIWSNFNLDIFIKEFKYV